MLKVWRAYRDESLWPSNYFRVQILILKFVGIDLMNEHESLRYRIFSFISMSFIAIFTLLELYELFGQYQNFEDLANILSYLLTHFTGSVKTALLFRNRKRIGIMITKLQNPPFSPDDLRGGANVERKLIRSYILSTETMILVYYIVVMVVLSSGPMTTINLRLHAAQDDWLFPFVLKRTIYDLKHSPWFEMFAIYETFGMWYYAAIIATTYTLLSSIIAQLSVQLIILGLAYKNVFARADRYKHMEKNNLKTMDIYVEQMLSDSIDHHLQIFDLANEVEDLISMMVLVVLLTSTAHLCFLLYMSAMVPLNSIKFVQNIFYWLILVCQVSMYCYWGNEITLAASYVAIDAFDSKWEDMIPSVARNVILIICRAQRPIFLTAGKFVPLSMQTLMSIIKGSFSYFMILRQVQEPVQE